MSTATIPAAPAGNVIPPAATAPATAPARNRVPRGQSAMRFDSLDAAKAAPRPSDKHEIIRVVRSEALAKAIDKPREEFYLANHRNAVQTALLKSDGYEIGSAEPKRIPSDPAKRVSRVADLLETMSEEDRQKLFARYMAGGNAAAAAALPAAPPRVDTSSAAEFDGKGNGNVATPAGKAPAAPAAPATNNKGGSRKH